jgi:hypothetical protein
VLDRIATLSQVVCFIFFTHSIHSTNQSPGVRKI